MKLKKEQERKNFIMNYRSQNNFQCCGDRIRKNYFGMLCFIYRKKEYLYSLDSLIACEATRMRLPPCKKADIRIFTHKYL